MACRAGRPRAPSQPPRDRAPGAAAGFAKSLRLVRDPAQWSRVSGTLGAVSPGRSPGTAIAEATVREAKMKIICATDFSPQGRAAADMAAGLARTLGEGVCLLHVIDPTPLLGLELGPGGGSWEGALRDTAARELSQEAE